DIHYTHYGRLCHIETPEGANIGLIMSLGLYADIDEYGFIITPYRVIDKVNKKITEKAVYLNAIEEDNFYIAPFDTPVENGYFKEEMVKVRYKGEILIVPAEKVDFIDISPVQTISMAAGLIPFLHHDDATRASMGANMQRQAVPLINPESPLVKTGIEKLIAKDFIKYSDVEGYVKYVDATKIVIETKSGDKEYGLLTFFPTKKETTIRERAIIKKGDYVKVGDPLYYQFNLKTNELSLGRNVLVAYMPFYGYNYEDAILISERLVKDDVYTSIHIEKYEVDLKRTKLGEEEFTKDIPNAPKALLEKLDDNGYIKIGSYIKPADILVGKVTPKG
ncbi:MAG: DNA-directed RNA polymerase subunit beta, partial [Thermodesulfobacteriaceae bacterium]|nr:DNA-directed RNA polymerase subunit beta [Thermodesulfobacteriaceae bacterium]